MELSYRKTSNGEWVVYGPLAAFKEPVWTPEGEDTITVDTVQVAKRSGEVKTERIARLGRPFLVDGVQMVYGYTRQPARSEPRRNSIRRDHEDCLSFAGGCGPSCPYNFR